MSEEKEWLEKGVGKSEELQWNTWDMETCPVSSSCAEITSRIKI